MAIKLYKSYIWIFSAESDKTMKLCQSYVCIGIPNYISHDHEVIPEYAPSWIKQDHEVMPKLYIYRHFQLYQI